MRLKMLYFEQLLYLFEKNYEITWVPSQYKIYQIYRQIY